MFICHLKGHRWNKIVLNDIHNARNFKKLHLNIQGIIKYNLSTKLKIDMFDIFCWMKVLSPLKFTYLAYDRVTYEIISIV